MDTANIQNTEDTVERLLCDCVQVNMAIYVNFLLIWVYKNFPDIG